MYQAEHETAFYGSRCIPLPYYCSWGSGYSTRATPLIDRLLILLLYPSISFSFPLHGVLPHGVHPDLNDPLAKLEPAPRSLRGEGMGSEGGVVFAVAVADRRDLSKCCRRQHLREATGVRTSPLLVVDLYHRGRVIHRQERHRRRRRRVSISVGELSPGRRPNGGEESRRRSSFLCSSLLDLNELRYEFFDPRL